MFKKIGLSVFALIATVGLALAASGLYMNYPVVNGNGTVCTSFGNNGVCNQFQPVGPTFLQGTETFLADTNYVNAQGLQSQPVDIAIPTSLIGNGYGGTTVNTTTGAQTPAVANSISTYIYAGAGAATFTTFTFPPNPFQNQKLCLVNAGTGIVTLSSLLVGTTGQVFVGTTPTSLPVATAVGTAGTVTLGTNCWLYNLTNTTWYRVL